MSRKKILFFLESLGGGGAEKVLTDVICNLDYSKYDVTVCTVTDGDIYQEKVSSVCKYTTFLNTSDYRKGGVKKFLFWLNIKFIYSLPSELIYKLYIRKKYDIEIAFIEGFATKFIAGSSNPRSKKYAWVHIDLQQNPWTSFLYKNVDDECEHYKMFDKILCVSESVRGAFLEKFSSVDERRVQVQYNPINRDEILSMAREECNGYNIGEKKRLRMVAVGRLVAQKGFDRLIKVCSKLVQKGYAFELLILGEGSERAALENMIAEMNLSNTVRLLGYLKNPYAIMTTADLLVCSSRSEGFSTVLTEGVVLGLPIISTECAGVRELFGTRECGQIVDNDSESLYCALKDVLDDPEKLEYYKAESLERGINFNLSKTMRDIESLLDI